MSPQQLFFAMFVLVPMCSALLGGHLATLDMNPRVYCGRALARMIANICYEDPGIEKKAETGSMYGALIPPYYKEQDNHINWPWMSSSKARALGSNRGKRFGGGVADECCEKPCSISELLYYC